MLTHMWMLIKGKDILILGKGPTQGLDDTALTVEQEWIKNLSVQSKRF